MFFSLTAAETNSMQVSIANWGPPSLPTWKKYRRNSSIHFLASGASESIKEHSVHFSVLMSSFCPEFCMYSTVHTYTHIVMYSTHFFICVVKILYCTKRIRETGSRKRKNFFLNPHLWSN